MSCFIVLLCRQINLNFNISRQMMSDQNESGADESTHQRIVSWQTSMWLLDSSDGSSRRRRPVHRFGMIAVEFGDRPMSCSLTRVTNCDIQYAFCQRRSS